MNNMNDPQIVYTPYEFTDVLPSGTTGVTSGDTVTYTGVSGQSRADSPLWKIKKIETIGTETTIKYPDGDQSSTFKWSLRAGYTYI